MSRNWVQEPSGRETLDLGQEGTAPLTLNEAPAEVRSEIEELVASLWFDDGHAIEFIAARLHVSGMTARRMVAAGRARRKTRATERGRHDDWRKRIMDAAKADDLEAVLRLSAEARDEADRHGAAEILLAAVREVAYTNPVKPRGGGRKKARG